MIGEAILSVELAVQQVRSQLEDGQRFVGAFYDRDEESRAIHYVVGDPHELELTTGIIGDAPVEALSGVYPAAEWAEREIRDRFGVTFAGIPEPRPLLPPEDATRYQRAIGPEVSTVLYGPVRSGIVESARWIIETAGEDFLAVYPSMFYKHRGLEQRFEDVEIEQATFVAEHVSGATAASHATCCARAIERAFGIHISGRARAARLILVEFERIHQHLDALAKLADDGSLSVGAAQTFAMKERVHRLLAAATGNRFSRGVIRVGGVEAELFARLRAICEEQLEALERDAVSVVDGLFGTQSLLDRLIGTGRLSADQVRAYGAVGPVARGSGVPTDSRMGADYILMLNEGDEALETDGDAFARAQVRATEIRRSFNIIKEALAAQLDDHPCDATRLGGFGLARVESPQGELVYFARVGGGKLLRMAIRSASFANWPLFVQALPGNIFTDFSFIEHSFGLIQAETDR